MWLFVDAHFSFLSGPTLRPGWLYTAHPNRWEMISSVPLGVRRFFITVTKHQRLSI